MLYCARKNGRHPAAQAQRAVPRLPRHRRRPLHGHGAQARPGARAAARRAGAGGCVFPQRRRGALLDADRAAGLGGDRRLLCAARLAVILLDLAVTFGVLSIIAFGGMPAVMPEMQRLVVEAKGWTTAE